MSFLIVCFFVFFSIDQNNSIMKDLYGSIRTFITVKNSYWNSVLNSSDFMEIKVMQALRSLLCVGIRLRQNQKVQEYKTDHWTTLAKPANKIIQLTYFNLLRLLYHILILMHIYIHIQKKNTHTHTYIHTWVCMCTHIHTHTRVCGCVFCWISSNQTKRVNENKPMLKNPHYLMKERNN